MMKFGCRLTSADISVLTVSLGMHTVGDKELGTTNDAHMTRRVSRVIMHNGYYIIKNAPVSVFFKIIILNQSFTISEVRHIFYFVPFLPITD